MTQVAPDHGRRARRDAEGRASRAGHGVPTASSARTEAGHRRTGPLVAELQDDPDLSRGRHATSLGQNFPRLVGWTVLGSVIPGLGLIGAGRRRLGITVMAFTAAMLGALIGFFLFGDAMATLAAMAGSPNRFLVAAAVLGLLILGWVVVVLATHSAGRRFAHLTTMQRVLGAALVTSLVGIVGLPAARIARDALIARDTITGIFGDGPRSGGARPAMGKADPWAGVDRVNVLLVGSDAGADRIGIRPDTLIVASIAPASGNTVLFSLPRNLQRVPFPVGSRQAAEYPDGFDCRDNLGVPQCLLNAFWTFGEERWKQYYPQEKSAFDAGLRATKDAVEQVTGLKIDQYAMLNLRGFQQFVDAIGGLRLNVRERLPIGGSSENPVASSWIEPGLNQKLNGYRSLWYARSRWSTSDFDRMQRQRCVIAAVVDQADPLKLAQAFPQIAAAAKSNITTDIPLSDVEAWVTLSQRVKGGTVRSLPFTDAVVNTVHPNLPKVRDLVQRAIADSIAPPAVTPSPTAKPSAKPSGKPTTKPGSSPRPSGNPETAQDVKTVC